MHAHYPAENARLIFWMTRLIADSHYPYVRAPGHTTRRYGPYVGVLKTKHASISTDLSVGIKCIEMLLISKLTCGIGLVLVCQFWTGM
jgi:hypothetical protein